MDKKQYIITVLEKLKNHGKKIDDILMILENKHNDSELINVLFDIIKKDIDEINLSLNNKQLKKVKNKLYNYLEKEKNEKQKELDELEKIDLFI